MLGDAHWTNYAENREFFLNANNPTNFERTYNTAFLLYKAVGVVNEKTDFDQIMDFSVIKKLGAEEKYAKQKNEYEVSFAPVAASGINVESTILTKTIVVQFFPNSSDLYKKVDKTGQSTPGLYDPNVDFVIEEVAKVSKQYGAARILIEGHTDGSMKGQADPGAGEAAVVRSRQRGEAGAHQQVPAAGQPVHGQRPGLGPSRRPRPTRTTTPRTGVSRSRWCRRRPSSAWPPERPRPSRRSLSCAPEIPKPPRWLTTLRAEPPAVLGKLLGLGCILFILIVWYLFTAGDSAADRPISPSKLPSPGDVFDSFDKLEERGLVDGIIATLVRVLKGFGLAALVGVGFGVLAASFRAVAAFLNPLVLFGRSLPLAALIPITHPVVWHRREAEGDVHLHRVGRRSSSATR